MRVDIIQGKGNKPLRRICHEGEVYVMAPKKGTYRIQLYNHTSKRRVAVVTVDGVNVISGENGDFNGKGYVVGPKETIEIPGWRRDDGTVAAFLFRPEEKSYANQTGRGTSNVGVVGVAVFDEKPKVRCRCPNGHHDHHHHHHYPSWGTNIFYSSGGGGRYGSNVGTGGTMPEPLTHITCSTAGGGEEQTLGFAAEAQPRSVSKGITRRRRRIVMNDAPEPSSSIDVGTGYGHEVDFETTSVAFERATDEPAVVLCLRYAVKERLQSWGVPVNRMKRPDRKPSPRAFPVSQGPSVPPPPGWRG
jgi:hypothetical protein